jgi:DNA polymerase
MRGNARTIETAAPLVPDGASVDELRAAALQCHACHLWTLGTQTVFGAGEPAARLMLVGEIPGDYEDRMGEPFVGPAGQLLDDALAAAGIDREQIYLTNVVKHFKWKPQGRRRLHDKPNLTEIRACRPWLDAEIAAVRPKVLGCLGATAAQALLGKDFRVTTQRGQPIESPLAPYVVATIHPSAILRVPDDADRRAQMERFIADLREIKRLLG